MPWPPRFLFISGRMSIDFVHTGGEGFRARWERWHSPADLADWLEACASLGVRTKVGPRDLEQARRLREAIWSAAQAVVRGDEIPASARQAIVRVASRPDLVPTLRDGARGFAGQPACEQALSSVARDAIGLFGTDLKRRLRTCEGKNCFLLFVDTSRPGKRAWCTMKRCGNLQKISRYRSGQRRNRSTVMTQAKRALARPVHPMPAFIRSALGKRGLAKTYAARPPYQRNDYVGWITRAKLDATKKKRLDQMLDELERGDVYMNMRWSPGKGS